MKQRQTRRPKLTPLAACAVISLFALLLSSVRVGAAGVKDSPHNLNNAPANVTVTGADAANTEVCRPCHVPHNAAEGEGELWNHEVDANATYTLYNEVHTGTKYATNYVGLDRSAKLCLSCHDGAIAVDSYGGDTGTYTISGAALIGDDLSTVHPIGLKYPGLSDDGVTWTTTSGYNDPTAVAFGAATYADGSTFGSAKGVQMVKGKVGGTTYKNLVSCRSCHHSHNNALGNFLRTTNHESGLCLKCHSK